MERSRTRVHRSGVGTATKILGQILLETEGLSEEALAAALDEQRESAHRLGEILVARGVVDDEAVARALARQLSLPYAAPPLEPEPEAAALLRPDYARRCGAVPLRVTSRSLCVAMADPLDLSTLDDVRFQVGRRVDPEVASPTAVRDAAARLYGGELSELLDQLPDRLTRIEETDSGALEEAARAAPVVRLVDHILERAVEARASDIHLEEEGGKLRVRNRIDGVLRTTMQLPAASHDAVISRIKIVAGMDISVKRRPQDGGFRLRHGTSSLTFRTSTLPVEGGEKAVLRILDPKNAPASLDSLGFSAHDLRALRRLVQAGQGVILAAGPTGSGKSSTLFGALGEIDREGQNVVTIEDPIEYRVPGVNQVQVEPKAGLTFPAALRSLLRQDPDVVMIGEIRDGETAEIAMTAAVTGHLVLSTIHTSDAPGAITRLLNMGVPTYLVAGGLTGVVAQRLVRRICTTCRGRPGGCHRCVDGYAGRTGVFQVLVMTDPLREEVTGGASAPELRRLAARAGMGTLADDARRKVAEGVTTPHEVARVVRVDPSAALPCARCGGSVPAGALGCPGCGDVKKRVCACGVHLRVGWRFCPGCLRHVRGVEAE